MKPRGFLEVLTPSAEICGKCELMESETSLFMPLRAASRLLGKLKQFQEISQAP